MTTRPQVDNPIFADIDALIRRDPAKRGLIATEPVFGPLCSGHLAGAAQSLASDGKRAVIVTGFFIPKANPPAAETDGPPGACLLALALSAAEIETQVLTDSQCAPAVQSAAEASGLPQESIVTVPDKLDLEWCRNFLQPTTSPISHLISVERVGPSHTWESFLNQDRDGEPPADRFEELVREPDRDHCHNMRGVVIDEFTAPLHLLFDAAAEHGISTIGVGDGGNEIGMGAVAWEELQRRLPGESAGRVPCRVATDWNIVAGTSNWGAYALSAATLLASGKPNELANWDEQHQQSVIESMVSDRSAVDGVTAEATATVDGIPFLRYIEVWTAIRELVLSDGHET
ncbi:MAG: hypothetical protein CMJ78_08825 [Planctomycetaceae bacterium]|nr:hypothetical protein [Planctomycetaceae bacterium]